MPKLTKSEKEYAIKRLRNIAAGEKIKRPARFASDFRDGISADSVTDLVIKKADIAEGYHSLRDLFYWKADAEKVTESAAEQKKFDKHSQPVNDYIDSALQVAIDNIMLGADALSCINTFVKCISKAKEGAA